MLITMKLRILFSAAALACATLLSAQGMEQMMQQSMLQGGIAELSQGAGEPQSAQIEQ